MKKTSNITLPELAVTDSSDAPGNIEGRTPTVEGKDAAVTSESPLQGAGAPDMALAGPSKAPDDIGGQDSSIAGESSSESEDSDYNANEHAGDTRKSLLDYTEDYPSDPAALIGHPLEPELIRELVETGPCQPGLNSSYTFKKDEKARSFHSSWYTKLLPNGLQINREWLVYSPKKTGHFVFLV